MNKDSNSVIWSLIATSALAIGAGTPASAVPLIGTGGGTFSGLSGCDSSGGFLNPFDCQLARANTVVRWGSDATTFFGGPLVNPSTLTSVAVNINTNTDALDVVLGQLNWFNSSTSGAYTPNSLGVTWNFSVNFTSPSGPDGSGSAAFGLSIVNTPNPTGDTVTTFNVGTLSGVTLNLAGITISNLRYDVIDGAGGSGNCTGTSLVGGTWLNCEDNNASLQIKGDFRTKVPEPGTLALLGLGLAGLGLMRRKRAA